MTAALPAGARAAITQVTAGWTPERKKQLLDRLAAEAAKRGAMLHREEWLANPVKWATDRADVFLWSKQREIIEAVRDHPKVAVMACHSAGKSAGAATTVAWWLDVHGREAVVLTTAPTFPQVRAILWKEIRRLHQRGDLFGRVNQTEWMDDQDNIIGLGRKPADYDESAFQGIHARYPLVVIDESGGVPRQLFTAAETIASNENARILAIGNPDDASSHFAVICSDPTWHVIHIPAAATPNFTGEDVPPELKPMLLSRAWVEDKARAWGVDNPLYISKVLAEFPTDSTDGIIPGKHVAAARSRALTLRGMPGTTPTVLGMDVGAGGDKTIVYRRDGVTSSMRLTQAWVAQTHEPDQAAELAVRACVEANADRINIDATAIGWGIAGMVKDRLKLAGSRCLVVPVVFGARANEPEKYANMRAELWWGVGRTVFQAGDVDLTRVDHADDLHAELVMPKWHTNSRGQIVVESKDTVRSRLGASPDHADAALLAMYDGLIRPARAGVPSGQIPTRSGQRH